MADQTTSYVIQVNDGVDPSIERKLTGITTGATKAGTACAQLQQSLDSINGSGLSSASQAIRDAGTAQRSLSTTTSGYSRSAQSATTATNNLSTSMTRFETQVVATDAALTTLVATSSGYAAVASAIAQATNKMAAAQTNGTAATNGYSGGMRNMSATLTLAEGRLGSANRLAGQFLSTLVGSSPIVQAAFSVLGALALVAVLAQVVHAIYDVAKAYNDMGLAARQAAIDQANAAAAGNETVKPGVGITEGIARAGRYLTGNLDAPGSVQSVTGTNVVIKTTAALQQQQAMQNALLSSQNQLNEAGLKSSALAKQKQTDIQAEIGLREKQINQVTDLLYANTTLVQSADTTQAQAKAALSQITSGRALVAQLGNEISVLTNQKAAEGKVSAVDGVKDEAAAARKEMVALNKAFKDYEGSLTTKITPQQGLQFWQNAESGLKHYGDNIDSVNGKEAVYQQQIAARNDEYLRGNEALQQQISLSGAYSDALKIQQQLNIAILAAQKEGQPLTATELAQRRALITTVVTQAGYMSELGTQYTAAAGPARTYSDAVKAIQTLLASDPAHTANYLEQLKDIAKSYNDAVNPAGAYLDSLKQQASVLSVYGADTSTASELLQFQIQLRQNHKTAIDAETAAIKQQLQLMQSMQTVQTDVTNLYNQNQGAQVKLTQSRLADVIALSQGIITHNQFTTALNQNNLATLQLAQDRGVTTFSQNAMVAIGSLTKGYTTFTTGASKAFTTFFSTLESGFADNIAHVLVFGGSIKEALLSTAQQAVAGLISSLIKLGIQWVINSTLGQSIGAAAAAAQIVTATVTGTAVAEAWAPAAAMASLASFGANGAAADAAIESTSLLTTLLATTKFATGGYVSGPGTSTSDSIPALLSNGEFVVNASAYAAHKGAINAINAGARTVFSSSSAAQGNAVSSGGSNGLNITVQHDGSTAIQVVRGTSPGEVQIIAKQAAQQVLSEQGDEVIAGHIGNANSKVSRSLQQSTSTTRKR